MKKNPTNLDPQKIIDLEEKLTKLNTYYEELDAQIYSNCDYFIGKYTDEIEEMKEIGISKSVNPHPDIDIQNKIDDLQNKINILQNNRKYIQKREILRHVAKIYFKANNLVKNLVFIMFSLT